MWTTKIPVLQSVTPSRLAASLLIQHVPDLSGWVAVDFCAGGGGPTPSIERFVNARLEASAKARGNRTVAAPVRFVLTDLHPHPEDWAAAAARSPNLTYESKPLDASAAAQDVIDKYAVVPGPGGTQSRKRVMRLFNLAFHHFDDNLARAILKNTVETSDGFA